MCDQRHHSLYSETDFFQHYMHQHAIMMQYFTCLHQNTSAINSYNPYPACHCESNSCMNECYRPTSHECSSLRNFESNTSTSSEYEVADGETCSEINEDDDESQCEFELNVDAIIAMRAAKKELKPSESEKSESESIVLVDSDKEEFEFVELGSFKTLTSTRSHGVGNLVNRKQELESQKEIMKYLYGEKSSTIGGLETAMAVNFERLCDIHQPSLWPVLPVRL